MKEELLGISRGANEKDVDWSAVAATVQEIVVKKPEKISVAEVLSKAKKVQKTSTSLVITPSTKGK